MEETLEVHHSATRRLNQVAGKQPCATRHLTNLIGKILNKHILANVVRPMRYGEGHNVENSKQRDHYVTHSNGTENETWRRSTAIRRWSADTLY